MKTKTLTFALLLACILVPGAAAKGSHAKGGKSHHVAGPAVHSHGNGQGGSSHAHAASHGPSHASHHASHSSAQGVKPQGGKHGGGKHADPGAADNAQGDDGDTAEAAGSADESGLNPSQVCRQRRDEIGAEAFALEHGTNLNRANAFGKCVAAAAHGSGFDQSSADDEQGDDGASAPDPEDGGQQDGSDTAGGDGGTGTDATGEEGATSEQEGSGEDTAAEGQDDAGQVGEDDPVATLLAPIMRLIGR